MANLFSNLLDRDNPTKKLQKEIEGMEFKKQSLVSALQNEIQTARNKINDELLKIGVDVYANHISGEEIDDKLAGHFNAIESLNQLISEKEAKIDDIANRYDEEIGMLNAHLELAQPQAVQQSRSFAPPAQDDNTGGTCKSCGKAYAPGVDMFCMGCGQKLS